MKEYPETKETIYRMNGTLMRIAQALENIEDALKKE